MNGFVVALGKPERFVVSDMLNRISHRGGDFTGLWESDSLIMGQNYLKADLDRASISREVPLSGENGCRLCYDGQLGNAMEESAERDAAFAEETLLLDLYRDRRTRAADRAGPARYQDPVLRP